jgi:hypothetical protein
MLSRGVCMFRVEGFVCFEQRSRVYYFLKSFPSRLLRGYREVIVRLWNYNLFALFKLIFRHCLYTQCVVMYDVR